MKIVRTALLSGLVVAAAAACGNLAFTAGNTVAASKVGTHTAAVTAATLQKAVCAANGVNPTTVVSGAANPLNGTTGADLILGTRNNTQTLNGGGGGKDCIVAGSVPNGKTITMSPSAGSGSVCVKGPGPGSYTYGTGCAVKV
jgi:hypothetical protein